MGKNIEDWSARYALVKPLIGMVHRLQYRNIIVKGRENIPKEKPIIFAPNHQNALMDPLAIVFTTPLQPVFLARADIFKSRFIASILRFFKILPVYRIRDGKDQLNKNNETFETCIRILKKNKPLCLFPEAAHVGMKSMLPHKKAIPRLAFLAGSQTNYTIDLQVVPVGIFYSHYSRFRSDLIVHYGPPVAIKPYFEMIETEGETKATFALRDKIFTEVSKCCVHVPDKENYPIYEMAFSLLKPFIENEKFKQNKPADAVLTYQYLIVKLEEVLRSDPDLLNKLKDYTNEINLLKNNSGLTERTLQKGKITFTQAIGFIVLQLLLTPFSLTGLLVNGWLFYMVFYGITRKVNDPQFVSSFSFGGSLILLPVWIIIQFFIYFAFGVNLALSAFFAVASVPLGIVAWESGQAWLHFLNRLKYNRNSKSGNIPFKHLLETRKKFIKTLKPFIV
ncbi:MAG: 1-acyl-sn-glycerol-3-phosphate acyltransferase [Prolixibacteraceae bacterium]|nr:1-acyl-sn-glycerol-3-phosphate acyltransferase [Prolixibacteraceae bacterium]